MFTGLIETIGRVVAAERRGSALRLRVDLGRAAEGVRPGDSINLSGACQTVADLDGSVAAFDSVAETLARTTLGGWKPGTPVNVERSLRPGDRLGGHFVAGHVDATGRVLENREGADGWRLRVEAPEALLPEIAPKGSIAVDGVSLTVAAIEPPVFGVALIPTTLRETTLGSLAPGDLVNLETDLLAKYVRRAIGAVADVGAADPSCAAKRRSAEQDRRLADALRRAGFLDPT
jgi:riboflavin synthase